MRKILFIAIGLFLLLDLVVVVLIFGARFGQPVVTEIVEKPEPAFVADEPVAPGEYLDTIFVLNIESVNEEVVRDKLSFTGIITVVNGQGIEVEGAVVSFQLVDNLTATINQTITNEEGIGEFSFAIDQGNWRIEILDVAKEEFEYSKNMNEVGQIKGVFSL